MSTSMVLKELRSVALGGSREGSIMSTVHCVKYVELFIDFNSFKHMAYALRPP